MKLKFVPLSDRVLVDPVEVEEKTESGIIVSVSDTAKIAIRGVVVAHGPGRFENGGYVPMHVQNGDLVTWMKFAGSEVEVDGKKYLLMRETDISGVIGQ